MIVELWWLSITRLEFADSLRPDRDSYRIKYTDQTLNVPEHQTAVTELDFYATNNRFIVFIKTWEIL